MSPEDSAAFYAPAAPSEMSPAERVRDAASDLLAALSEVREWISNWSPNFAQDDAWPATEDRINAAIAKATGA